MARRWPSVEKAGVSGSNHPVSSYRSRQRCPGELQAQIHAPEIEGSLTVPLRSDPGISGAKVPCSGNGPLAAQRQHAADFTVTGERLPDIGPPSPAGQRYSLRLFRRSLLAGHLAETPAAYRADHPIRIVYPRASPCHQWQSLPRSKRILSSRKDQRKHARTFQ